MLLSSGNFHQYLFGSSTLPALCAGGTKTFYLVLGGHTDTLQLRALDHCSYSLLATFDGHDVPIELGDVYIPDHFVLQRR